MERLDVTFEIAQRDVAQCSLRTGDKVELLHMDDGSATHLLTSGGDNLGSLSREHADVLSGGEYSGHIRTVKRDAASGSVNSVVVRFIKTLSSNDRREDGEGDLMSLEMHDSCFWYLNLRWAIYWHSERYKG